MKVIKYLNRNKPSDPINWFITEKQRYLYIEDENVIKFGL